MSLSERIRQLFYPVRCVGCDTVVPCGSPPVCRECEQKLCHPAPVKSRCEICFLSADDCCCGNNLYYDRLAFLFFNENAARKTVHKLKFRGRADLAEGYAELLKTALGERDMLNADYIVPVPMSAKHKKKRGYNQAELLATELSETTGIPCENLIYRYLEGGTQHELDKVARTGNILGAFEAEKEKLPLIEGKRIIVADDIITGGSTANEAAKTLKIFGAEEVYIATVVATRKKRHTVADK